MSESKIETVKGMCVIALTKHIMTKYNLNQAEAFSKLMNTTFYKIFLDAESRLYLEPDYFLFTACDLDIDGKTDQMYSYIQSN